MRHHRWLPLLYGQAIALVVSSMNAASYTLSYHNHVNTQLFQLFFMYLLLSVHILFRERKGRQDGWSHRLPFTSICLQMPWWKYMLLSMMDVIPNFMQLVSFQYTSLTSTTLLGSLTVPSTMLVSRVVLSRTFGKSHYVGVVLCLVGGGMTIWTDFDGDTSTRIHSWVGDVLAVLAAVVNGSVDVFAEYCVKNVDRYEMLGMLGLYGTIFTGIACSCMERQALLDMLYQRPGQEQLEIAGVIAWYVASVLVYYMAEALFLVSSEATLLNLSLQTSNLWAIGFSFLVYHVTVGKLFYPALFLVVGGVCVYELTNPTSENEPSNHLENEESLSLQSTNSYDEYSSTSISDVCRVV